MAAMELPDDDPEVLEFRRKHAEMTARTRPEPRPAPRMPSGFDPEATMRMEALVTDLRDRMAEMDARPAVAAPPPPPPRSLAVTTAIVLIVLIVAGLAAWIGYLYFTRG